MLFYEEPSEFELANMYIQEQYYNATCSLNESIKSIKTPDTRKMAGTFKTKLKNFYDKKYANMKVTMVGYPYPTAPEVLIDDMKPLIVLGNKTIAVTNPKASENDIKKSYDELRTLADTSKGFDTMVKVCLSTTSAYHLKLSDCRTYQQVLNKILNYYRTGHDSTTLEEKQKITFDMGKLKDKSYYDNLFNKAEKTGYAINDQYKQLENILDKLNESSHDSFTKAKTSNDLNNAALYTLVAGQAAAICINCISFTMKAIIEVTNQQNELYRLAAEQF